MPIETQLDECQSCAMCCMGQDILVKDEEIVRIATKIGKNSKDFTEKRYHHGLTRGFKYHILKRQPNGDCFFLIRNMELFFCSIYEFRPELCAEYPNTDGELVWCEEHGQKRA